MATKKVILRGLFNDRKNQEEIFIAEGDTGAELLKVGTQWLKEHGHEVEPYSRYWCENNELFCDYGSWGSYLVVTPFSDEEFAKEFLH